MASARAAKTSGGEFALLAQVRAAVESLGRGRGVVVGIGDDCAVVEASAARGKAARRRTGSKTAATPLQVLTTDSMVEGVHFRAAWLTPRELGVRAFRAAVSDIAAMGARPRFVLLSLEVPGDVGGFGSREALALVRALAADAKRTGASLVGGNVSGAERAGVHVTVIGECTAKPVLRSGARAGDFVFVTGSLGGSAAGCRALLAKDVIDTRRRSPATRTARARAIPTALTAAYRRPPLRLEFAAALAGRGIARAMIDVSDGLLQDLGHLADSSRVAIRVDASMVPVHRAAKLAAADAATAAKSRRNAAVALPPALRLALTGGEDYELAFTAPESALDDVASIASRYRVPVSVIGVVRKGAPSVTDLSGRPFAIDAAGFDHLRPRRAKANVRRR